MKGQASSAYIEVYRVYEKGSYLKIYVDINR